MAMCIHGQEYETCSFGCTFKTANQLRLNNDLLHEYIEDNRITHLKERITELEALMQRAYDCVPKGSGLQKEIEKALKGD